MGKKKLQGADGINFQMQLTIKGLETVGLCFGSGHNFPHTDSHFVTEHGQFIDHAL